MSGHYCETCGIFHGDYPGQCIGGKTYSILVNASDVTEHILVLVASCVEDWFAPDQPMPVDEFIDRLCDRYLNAEGFDVENLGGPAAAKIMRHARAVRRDLA